MTAVRAKSGDQFPDWPRLMRARKAALYLDISESFFLTLVEEGQMPKPVQLKSAVAWDRHDLDGAIDNLKDEQSSSSADRILRNLK